MKQKTIEENIKDIINDIGLVTFKVLIKMLDNPQVSPNRLRIIYQQLSSEYHTIK